MKRLLPKTFFGQLVLSTIAVQTLFLVLFIVYIVTSQRELALQRTRARMLQQMEKLSMALAKPMAKGDIASVHDVLNLSEIAPTIQGARLTDLAGNTLSMSQNGRSGGLDPFERAVLPSAARERQIVPIKNGQLEGVTAVLQGGKPVALLWLEPNAALSSSTANTVTRISLTYGGFALLANLLPIFVITQTMTRPLRRLAEATQRVLRRPDPDEDFPLPVTSSNEAGTLTVRFNTMVRELEDQRSGLLETLALLDSMLGNAPIGLAFFDRDLRHVRLNQTLADMYQLPASGPVGLRATELYPGIVAEEFEANAARVFESGTPLRDVEVSGPMPRGDGETRTWSMHFYPVQPQHDTVRWVGVIVVDITDRLRSEETLRKTEKLAAAGRLAASVAHEINNPLESVTNLLYLLQTHQPMDQTALEFVATAQAELARVGHITQQTLRFYRQNASRSMTNIPEVLQSIVQLYQMRITAARIQVEQEFRGTPHLLCYSGELRQLFANLIVNAVDAMPAGGRLWLRVRCDSGLSSNGRPCAGVHVTVADTGLGMSRETQAKIWEAFFTTKQATGTGLGLWVSEEIVRKHAGTVRVRSRQGERSGTCFRIFLPNVPEAGTAEKQQETAAVTA